MQINYAICWDPENPWTRNAQQQTTLQPCYLGVAQMRQVQLWVLVHVRGKTPHPILLSAYRIQDTTYFDPFADVFLGVHHILGHRAVVVWVTPLSRWHRHFRTAGARILCARAWQRLLRSALLDPLAGACRGNSRMFPRSVSQWLGDHSATHQQNKCCHIDCCSCYSSCSWGRRMTASSFLYVTGFFPYTDPGQKWLHRRKRQRMCKLNTFLRYMQCVYVHIYIDSFLLFQFRIIHMPKILLKILSENTTTFHTLQSNCTSDWQDLRSPCIFSWRRVVFLPRPLWTKMTRLHQHQQLPRWYILELKFGMDTNGNIGFGKTSKWSKVHMIWLCKWDQRDSWGSCIMLHLCSFFFCKRFRVDVQPGSARNHDSWLAASQDTSQGSNMGTGVIHDIVQTCSA